MSDFTFPSGIVFVDVLYELVEQKLCPEMKVTQLQRIINTIDQAILSRGEFPEVVAMGYDSEVDHLRAVTYTQCITVEQVNEDWPCLFGGAVYRKLL